MNKTVYLLYVKKLYMPKKLVDVFDSRASATTRINKMKFSDKKLYSIAEEPVYSIQPQKVHLS